MLLTGPNSTVIAMLKDELKQVRDDIDNLNSTLESYDMERTQLIAAISAFVLDRDELIKKRHELQSRIGKGEL